MISRYCIANLFGETEATVHVDEIEITWRKGFERFGPYFVSYGFGMFQLFHTLITALFGMISLNLT